METFLYVSFLGAQVDYESQVQTILSANCTGCQSGYSGGSKSHQL